MGGHRVFMLTCTSQFCGRSTAVVAYAQQPCRMWVLALVHIWAVISEFSCVSLQRAMEDMYGDLGKIFGQQMQV